MQAFASNGVQKRRYIRAPKTQLKEVKHSLPMVIESPQKELNHFFTEEQTDEMVRSAEEKLAAAALVLQGLTPDFKEVEKLYLSEKEKFDDAQLKVDFQSDLLKQLAMYRNKLKPQKQIRLLRTTSHVAKPRQAKGKTFPWTKLAIDTLTSMNRFLEVERLWEIILQEHEDINNDLKNDISKFRKTKGNTIMNWRITAKNNGRRPSKGLSVILYNDMIGLTSWVDSENKPVGQYLTVFMYNKEGV